MTTEKAKEQEVEIIEAVEIPSMEPGRVGKKDTWITYTVDQVKTYQLIIPSEEAKEAEIEKRIREAEKERAKLIGRKFTIK